MRRAGRVGSRAALALAGLALAATGCDEQVGPGYRGERLASLAGIVRVDGGPAERFEVGLRWLAPGGPGMASIERVVVPAEGAPVFPAPFALELDTPPPAVALREVGGARLAIAAVVAASEDALDVPAAATALGVDVAHVVGYLDRPTYDAEPGRPFSGLPEGYQVFDLVPDPASPTGARLVLAPGGMGTLFDLTVVPAAGAAWPAIDWSTVAPPGT